jgi:hypothetical protein
MCMKKISIKPALLFLVFVTLLSSCNKTASESSSTTFITKGSWKFSAATANGVDASAAITACYKDNIITFSTNGTAMIDEGATVCSPSVAGNYTWNFQNNETKLSISGSIIPGGNGTFNIVALNETTLILSQETTLIPAPVPVTLTITFVHP